MQKLFADIRQKPLEFVAGFCVLVIALGGASIGNVASTSLAVIFLISLFYARSWPSVWLSLSNVEKWLCYGFVLFTLSGALSYINAGDSDEFIKQMGRYIRFTLIIPVYFMLRYKRLDVSQYFLAGVVLSGFVFLGFTLHSMQLKPGMPVTGAYHHITFGDAAMLNAGIMGILLLTGKRSWLISSVIALSALCALYASFMSQARGAWLALPVYLILYTAYAITKKDRVILKIIATGLVASSLIIFTPTGELIVKRYDEAVTEVFEFAQGEKFDTSVGGRLSMWEIAYEVWSEHPLVGGGLGDFDEDMIRYQSMGMYPDVDVQGSTHNIYIQALVSTGLIGFVILCYALLVAPLCLLFRGVDRQNPFAMMGAFLVLSYGVFGLSESWILRAPAISIYLAYVIAISATLMASKEANKK